MKEIEARREIENRAGNHESDGLTVQKKKTNGGREAKI